MLTALVGSLCLTPVGADAQAPLAGRISGQVVSASGQPIENADVYVEQLQRRVRTGAGGQFRFLDVKNGKYTVGVRSVGYIEQSTKVTVNEKGAPLKFIMERAPFSLPSRITVASRGGLSGIIADTGYHPLANVSVRVMGESFAEKTDSAGAFFIPLRPGQYMVRIERDGFARQMIGVTVPENEGRQLAAWMVPQRKSNPRIGANLFEMNERMIRNRSPVSSKFFTREDIEARGITDLQTLIRIEDHPTLDPSCPVMINGGPRIDPLWRVMTYEIEYVELYLPKQLRQTGGPASASSARLANAKASMSTPPRGPCGNLIVVWTRQ